MTYDEKIAFLRRYRDALRWEKTIADEIEALRTEAARVTQALTGMPGGGDGQAIPRAEEMTSIICGAEESGMNIAEYAEYITGKADECRARLEDNP